MSRGLEIFKEEFLGNNRYRWYSAFYMHEVYRSKNGQTEMKWWFDNDLTHEEAVALAEKDWEKIKNENADIVNRYRIGGFEL
jgi:hypothetical protein